MTDFIDFHKLLPKAIQRFNMNRETRAAKACERFRKLIPELIGDDAHKHIAPKFVKGHILYIRVPSSVWAQRVFIHRHKLLEQINAEFDKPWVHDLRTVVES
jgi:hypothetical protein